MLLALKHFSTVNAPDGSKESCPKCPRSLQLSSKKFIINITYEITMEELWRLLKFQETKETCKDQKP